MRVRTRLLAVVAITLALAATDASAEPSLESIEQSNSLENNHQTPHTKWGKPLASGRIRTLFIVNQNPNINGLPLRHVLELMQRFDISGDAVLAMTGKGKTYAITYQGGAGVYGGETGAKRLSGLLKKPYDCYVVTGPVLGHLPATSRTTILKHVQQGAGLVLLYTTGDKDKPLLDQFQPCGAPTDSLEGIKVRCFQSGRGRVVSVQGYSSDATWNAYGPTNTQRVFGFHIRRDLFYEAQGRAVLWATNREPPLKFQIDLGSQSIPREQLASRKIKLSWNDSTKNIPRRIAMRIRSESRGSQQPRVIDDPGAAQGQREFQLPTLPAGTYWVDVIAEDKNGVTGWAIKRFDVTTGTRIAKVTLERSSGEAGDPITGTVEIVGPGIDGAILRVHVIDRHGRVLARQEFPKPGNRVAFSLASDTRMPGYLGIEAVIVQDGHDACYGYHGDAFTITRRKQDQWNFMVWGRLYATQFLELADDMLAANGVTTRMETSNVPWWYMTRAGMNYTPYCGSGLYRLPDMGPQEPTVSEHGVLERAEGCWNHEPEVSARLKKWTEDERDFRHRGVLAYSMGDEVAVLGSCLHPACWKVYQEWLKAQYGSIKALNQSWGTSFSGFAKIQPIVDETSIPWYPKRSQRIPWQLTWANNAHSSRGPTSGSTAWKDTWRNYPRYIDRKSFQYWNFANYCRRFRDAARQMDPHARCGVEGSDIFLDADIDVIVRNTGWWMPYAGENGGTTNEVIRSIAPGDYLHGNFMGETTFWSSILRGGNTLGKWRVDNMFTPAMQLKPAMKRMVKSGRIIFDGLGTLLNGNPKSEMLDEGIVMLHSMASVKMAKIGDGTSYGIFRWRDDQGKTRSGTPQSQFHVVNQRNHRAWHRNIRASGMQFRYTTDGQIKRGAFDPTRARVLVLSQYEVIGPEEEALIRKFVASGGTLIADVRPGIYGDRGRPRDGGVLDDLFGVRHTGSAPAADTTGSIKGMLDGTRVTVEPRRLFVNPKVKVTTGKPLGRAGDTPICIVNDSGRGRAVLLNFTMWSFPKLAVQNGNDDAASFFRTLLAKAGATPPLTLVDTRGRRHRNIEAMRWRTGHRTQVIALHGPFLGTWPEPNGEIDSLPSPFHRGRTAPVPVTVKLPAPRYVYEMRTGRSSGALTDSFETTAQPFVATLLVVSERPLHPPMLSRVSDTVVRGGSMKFRVAIPQALGRRVLKIRATRPDGKSARWFERSLIVRDGQGELDLPVAWNETVGKWTITATDLFTTRTTKSTVRIK